MRRRHDHVGIGRELCALPVGRERPIEVSSQVTGEAEVVPDVRVERARRQVARVGEPVGLDFVGAFRDQPRRGLEVRDGGVEPARRDVAVAAVSEEAGLGREFLDPRREDRDGFPVAAEIRRPAPEPDDGLGIVRR
jgi:hypothetical protein